MANEKLVIAKDFGGYYVTPESNYNAAIRNERKITRMPEFESAEEIIEYFCKYFGNSPEDFVII